MSADEEWRETSADEEARETSADEEARETSADERRKEGGAMSEVQSPDNSNDRGTGALHPEELAESTRGIALTVIDSLLGDSHPEIDTTRDTTRPTLVCSVSIDGPHAASVIVAVSPRLASWIAHRMFGVLSPDNDNAENVDAREAAREVSNIVAGNLKPLFGPGHTLGLPEDVADASTNALTSLAHVTVQHHGEALDIQVFDAA